MMKEPIKPGFYRISDNEYHAGPGISKSGLSDLLRSAAHYKTPDKETDTFADGRAFHVGCIEPERFEKEFVILPEYCQPGSGTGIKQRKEDSNYDVDQE